MGLSLSWAAVRGVPAEVVWRELGLRPTGRTREAPDVPFSTAVVAGGWVVVCANRDDRLVKRSTLEALSNGREVVGCFVEEHVNFSQAVGWKDGSSRWGVTHDEERAVDHLEVTGEPPPRLDALVASARAAPTGSSGSGGVFEVPADLAESEVGFRLHDLQAFEELEPSRPLSRLVSRHRRKVLALKALAAIALLFGALALIGAGYRRWRGP